MTVNELSRNQLSELKVNYLAELADGDLSYRSLTQINELVSDEEIFTAYSGTDFSEDDFFCKA